MKRVTVLGAGGFIGTHLVTRLKSEGCFVRGIDLKYPEFSESDADEFIIADLRDPTLCDWLFRDNFDEVYQLAADMGGAEFVFTGKNDANIMHNNALININVAHYATKWNIKKLFFSSSACVYPEKLVPIKPHKDSLLKGGRNRAFKILTAEKEAYPADPDSQYGWEKLVSERLYQSYARNHGLNIRIARFHNIYGPLSTIDGGREKAPAALCRKIIEAEHEGEVEILGDGKQTRSFLYIDGCITGILKLMASDYPGPVNIGSDELITINYLADLINDLSEKNVKFIHKIEDAPVGVSSRNSDNTLIKEVLDWAPNYPIGEWLVELYDWVKTEMDNWKYVHERNPDTGVVRHRRIK